MSSEKYDCPVCGKMFPANEINAHANLCLTENDVETSVKRKILIDVQSADHVSQPTKRLKASSSVASPDDGLRKSEKQCSPEVHIEMKQAQTVPEKLACHYAKQLFSPDNSTKLKSTYAKIFRPGIKTADKTNQSDIQSSSASLSVISQNHSLNSSNTKEGLSSMNDVTIRTTGLNSQNVKDNVSSANQGRVRSSKERNNVPLAEMMRPLTLDDYIGQEQVVGNGKMLRKLLESVKLPSMIFWGPPGCGKTTLAHIVAQKCKEANQFRFAKLSATTSGVADVKEAIKVAKNELRLFKRKTVLFIDEIHRFNKLQQDTFLPHVEDGTITLIGATTENPSFQVNNALLSRCKVIVLEKLSIKSLETILAKALNELGIVRVADEKDASTGEMCVTDAALEFLCGFSDGDARGALNALETAYQGHMCSGSENGGSIVIGRDTVKEVMQRTHVQYDRAGDEHYHCASALQKSIRGSDDNGALYWMTRMLEGGEDPLFVARRLVVTASEDIGLSDPQALPIAMATYQACQVIGRPECFINLSHCTTYLARAPKSNECIAALHAAQQSIREHVGPLPGVPLHLRNASTKLMKELGYGKGYQYSHSHSGSVQQSYLPPELANTDFYNRQSQKPRNTPS